MVNVINTHNSGHSEIPSSATWNPVVQLETLTSDSFSPRLQEIFAVSISGATLELVLKDVRTHGQSLNRQAFSLIFAGPLRPILPQSIYRLENPSLGTLEIFLVPLGPQGDVCRYEAVFT